MEARLREAQRRAAADTDALKTRHRAMVARLEAQLAARPSVDDALSARQAIADAQMSQFRVEIQVAAARDVLRRDINQLTQALDRAVTSLETLGRDLGSEAPVGVAQPFARLDPEPVLFAGSASGL